MQTNTVSHCLADSPTLNTLYIDTFILIRVTLKSVKTP